MPTRRPVCPEAVRGGVPMSVSGRGQGTWVKDNGMTISVTCGWCGAAFRVKGGPPGSRGQAPRRRAAVPAPPPPAPGAEDGPPEPGPADGVAPPLVMQEILQAFQGDIPPVRRTVAYRAGILALAAAVLVLPAA